MLAVLVGISMSALFNSLFSSVVGMFLAIVFLHGATVAAQLLQQTIGMQLYSRTRWVLVAIVVVAVGIGLAAPCPRVLIHLNS